MAKVVLIVGEGRGKTTNAVGYVSQHDITGKDIVIAQFLKTGKDCGECKFFEDKQNVRWMHFGKEQFFVSESQHEEFALLMKNGIKTLKEELSRKQTDILLLDELGVVFSFGMLSTAETTSLESTPLNSIGNPRG